jgi:hypothetical protein
MAKGGSEPMVEDALKATYTRAFREGLYTGNVTKTGSERLSAAGVRSVIENDAFLAAGKEIFKDHPGAMDVFQDVLKLSHEITRAEAKRAAPAAEVDRSVASAKEGLRSILNPIYGPLSHRALQINTAWKVVLNWMKPQEAINRTMDALLSDPETFIKAYEQFGRLKPNTRNFEKATKMFTNAMNFNEADTNRFKAEQQKIWLEEQTEAAKAEAEKKKQK